MKEEEPKPEKFTYTDGHIIEIKASETEDGIPFWSVIAKKIKESGSIYLQSDGTWYERAIRDGEKTGHFTSKESAEEALNEAIKRKEIEAKAEPNKEV